jgi:hypothetical protein
MIDQNKYVECRVFKSTVFLEDVIFYFPLSISYKEIKYNTKSSFLKKDDFIGKFIFHEDFLNLQDNQKINNNIYYYTYYIPENQK